MIVEDEARSSATRTSWDPVERAWGPDDPPEPIEYKASVAALVARFNHGGETPVFKPELRDPSVLRGNSRSTSQFLSVAHRLQCPEEHKVPRCENAPRFPGLTPRMCLKNALGCRKNALMPCEFICHSGNCGNELTPV